MVAAPYLVQESLFPKFVELADEIADEIALMFHDEVIFRLDVLLESRLITKDQYPMLEQLDSMFDDKPKEYWTKNALQYSEELEQCRLLARRILTTFTVDFDDNPSIGWITFVPTNK